MASHHGRLRAVALHGWLPARSPPALAAQVAARIRRRGRLAGAEDGLRLFPHIYTRISVTTSALRARGPRITRFDAVYPSSSRTDLHGQGRIPRTHFSESPRWMLRSRFCTLSKSLDVDGSLARSGEEETMEELCSHYLSTGKGSIEEDGEVRLYLPRTFEEREGTECDSSPRLPKTSQIHTETSSKVVAGGTIAELSIVNARGKNSLTGVMMAQLYESVKQLADWKEGTGVVIRGTSDFFCAGADLSFARTHLTTPEAGRRMSVFMRTTLNTLSSLPLVSVAAIEGGAIGGGAELSTCADFRVMEDSAFIQFVQVKMGVTPGWGGAYRLTKIVGRRNALRVLCSGRRLSASDAEENGLVDYVSKKGESVAKAKEFLQALSAGGEPAAVRAAKSVVAAADVEDFRTAVEHEQCVFHSMWGGEANKNALRRSQKGRRG